MASHSIGFVISFLDENGVGISQPNSFFGNGVTAAPFLPDRLCAPFLRPFLRRFLLISSQFWCKFLTGGTPEVRFCLSGPACLPPAPPWSLQVRFWTKFCRFWVSFWVPFGDNLRTFSHLFPISFPSGVLDHIFAEFRPKMLRKGCRREGCDVLETW